MARPFVVAQVHALPDPARLKPLDRVKGIADDEGPEGGRCGDLGVAGRLQPAVVVLRARRRNQFGQGADQWRESCGIGGDPILLGLDLAPGSPVPGEVVDGLLAVGDDRLGRSHDEVAERALVRGAGEPDHLNDGNIDQPVRASSVPWATGRLSKAARLV
jgi:hypothetical protein